MNTDECVCFEQLIFAIDNFCKHYFDRISHMKYLEITVILMQNKTICTFLATAGNSIQVILKAFLRNKNK